MMSAWAGGLKFSPMPMWFIQHQVSHRVPTAPVPATPSALLDPWWEQDRWNLRNPTISQPQRKYGLHNSMSTNSGYRNIHEFLVSCLVVSTTFYSLLSSFIFFYNMSATSWIISVLIKMLIWNRRNDNHDFDNFDDMFLLCCEWCI